MADNMRRLKRQLAENSLGAILERLRVMKGACA